MYIKCYVRAIVLAVFLMTSSEVFSEWNYQPVGNPHVNCISIDSTENEMYIGIEDVGLWHTNNGGSTWDGINDLIFTNNHIIPYSCTIIDVDADTVFYNSYQYAAESFIYLTYDGSVTWQQLDVSFLPRHHLNPDGFDLLMIDSNNHNKWYYVNGLYYATSIDGGESWNVNLIDSTESMVYHWHKHDMYVDEEDSCTIYIAGYYYEYEGVFYGGLYKSEDNGMTWESILPLNQLYGLTSASIGVITRLSNGNMLCMLTGMSNEHPEGISYLLTSSNNGITWQITGNGLPPSFYSEDLIEVEGSPGRLLAGSKYRFHGLYYSDDYGNNWERYNDNPFVSAYAVPDIYQNPWTQIIYLAVPGMGIIASDDFGESYRNLPNPSFAGSDGWRRAPSIGNNTVSFIDNMERRFIWNEEDNLFECVDTLMSSNDTTRVVSNTIWHGNGYQTRLIFEHNIMQNQTTAKIQLGNINDNNYTYRNAPIISGHDMLTIGGEEILYGFSLNDTIYWTSLEGESWQSNTVPVNQVIKHDILHNDIIYIISDNMNIYKSTDTGSSWDQIECPSNNPKQICFVDGYFCVLDDINTWVQLEEEFWFNYELPLEFNATRITVIERDAQTDIMISSSLFENNMYMSMDLGMSWQEVDYEMPYPDQIRGIKSMKYDPYRMRIWIVTGMGLAYCDIDSSVVKEPLAFQPAGQHLMEVYPNPFNETAKIRFVLPQSGETTVRVTDILGREVLQLVDGYRAQGEYNLPISTAGWSSGAYFVRLQQGQHQVVKKMILTQ